MNTLTLATSNSTHTSAGPAVDRHRPLRLWLVELRKLVDTPAGIALLALAALLAGVFGGGVALVTDETTLDRIVRLAGIPTGILLPVLAALLATGDRQHRTALTGYALTPRRGQVLAAKAWAVISLAVIAWVLALLAGVLIAAVATPLVNHPIEWSINWTGQLWFALGLVLAALSGYAVGLVAGNAPAAVSILLAWPVFALFLGIVPQIAEVLAWLDINALAAFADGIEPVEVARVATGVAAWVILPGTVGVLRELRREVR